MGLLVNGSDLDIYRQGGLHVMQGGRLYADELAGGWFTYPPFAAVSLVPLSMLNFPVAKIVWMAVSFVALTATIWCSAAALGYRRDGSLGLLCVAAAVLAVDIEAVRGTLWQGQVNLVLMAIIVWDLTRPVGARFRGWSVGIATGIKLTAVVFVPYLVVTRQWRAAITATATAAATVALTWCLLPADSSDYWAHAMFQIDRIGPLGHPGNFSIGGILATLWAPDPMPTIWWLICVAAAAICGYYACYRAELDGQRVLALTIAGLLSCTVPPLAWGHHWVWTVPLLAVAVDRSVGSAGRRRWMWGAAAAAIYLVVFMWFSAWLYRTSMRFAANYPTYVDALNAGIDHMTRFDRLLAVAPQPVLFVVVSVVTITFTGTARPRRRA
jgi:alpha-1,2-mannosyltransferase